MWLRECASGFGVPSRGLKGRILAESLLRGTGGGHNRSKDQDNGEAKPLSPPEVAGVAAKEKGKELGKG